MKKIVVIGAGLSGCVISNLLANKGYNVEIFERKEHIGGHIYDYKDKNGVLIHKYGPHIFHTSNDEVWEFVNRFDEFNGYINQVLVSIDNKLLELPINLNSIKKLFPEQYNEYQNEISIKFPNQIAVPIKDLLDKLNNKKNIDIINYIFENVYVNYTKKMWGLSVDKIDKSVLERVKIILNDSWNYFPFDKYQGLPKNGYTRLVEKMIDHANIKLHLNVDIDKILEIKNNNIYINSESVDVIYTGAIDELFKYKFGELPYRSLNIQFESYNNDSYQDAAVINYPSDKRITRICEYKKMTLQNISEWTTISKEYPGQYKRDDKLFNTRFYPINNEENNNLYNQYLLEAKKINNLKLLGRLAQYKYFDMDKIIEQCLLLIKKY